MQYSRELFLSIAAIVALGIGGQWLAWKLRIPAILLLLSLGCVAGSVLGFIRPDAVFGPLLPPLVSLAVAFVLFEGGLSLRFSELRSMRRSLLGLLTVGVATTWVLGALAAYWLLEMPASVALVLAAVLTVTGPTVIGPLLREIRPVGNVGLVAKWEGIVIDPIGATLAVLVFEATEAIRANQFGSAALNATVGFCATAAVGIGVGALVGWLLTEVLRRYWVPDYLRNPVTFMMVLLAFVLAEIGHHEAGLVSVTVMGMWLANQRHIDVHRILEFKEALTVLIISVLFIVLSARIELAQLAELGWGGPLLVAAMIFVVRPVAVGLSTFGSKLNVKERVFLAWFAPRGIVAAAVSSVFALRMGEVGDKIAPATFLIIMATVAVYGLSAGWLARKLGLSVANPQGVLIAGANVVARTIAAALKKEGFDTLMIDTRYDFAAKARDAGLRVQYANVLSDYVIQEIDFGGVGRFFALTSNDQVNTLAATRFREMFGTSNVFQLARRDVPGHRFSSDVAQRYAGRQLFSTDWNYTRLEAAIEQGATVKSTKLTEEFTIDDLLARVPDAQPMFIVDDGCLIVLASDQKTFTPVAGQTIVYLATPAPKTAEPE